MFCTMWPTLGGELSVVASKDVGKKMNYKVIKNQSQTREF